MRASRIIAAGGSALLLAFGVDLLSGRSQLRAGRRAVDEAFAQAEVALVERSGAVARFAGALAGSPGLERDAVDAMLSSHAAAVAARTRSEKIAADERVERALARLALLEEAYPDLRNPENFADIERDLAAAEGKVAIARGSYNDAVLRYNASLISFPRNIAARIFGFRREEDYFKPEAGSEFSK